MQEEHSLRMRLAKPTWNATLAALQIHAEDGCAVLNDMQPERIAGQERLVMKAVGEVTELGDSMAVLRGLSELTYVE